MPLPAVPLLSYQHRLRAGSRDRLGVGGCLGTCFLGLGRRARWSPLVPPRKMSSLSFSSSGCRGLEAATSRPLQPTLSPRGSFLSPESGPASGRRRSCFSESRFLCVYALSQPAPQEKAPGPGTRKPLPVRPRKGPGAHCQPRWGDLVDAERSSGSRAPLGKVAA